MNFSLPNPTTAGPPTPPPSMRNLPELQRPGSKRSRRPSAGKKTLAVGAAVVLGAAGVIALGVPGVRKPLASVFAGFADPSVGVVTYQVRRANLPVTVSERGNLESSENKDAYCQVEGQTTIIMIVPEGTRVTKGQLVCELDSAALKDQLTNQEITTRGASAAYQNAKLTREVAEIAVTEYKEGIFKQDQETAKGEIALAKSNRKRAEDRVDWSGRMYEKKYLSLGQVISEKLSLQQAIFSEEQAQTKLDVLLKYTKDKTIKELESEVEKSRSDELAKEATFQLEKSKEEKLRRLIKNCQIFAPADGLVVYANDPGRGGMGQTTPQIEEGATVRERQKIFSLPDITKMQVNTKIHESMIDRVSRGLRAQIKVDAFADETLPGTVLDVAPLPDPSSFFSSDIKVYTSHVAIERGLAGLRPGMTAQVKILVTQLDDVISVPVPAVLQYKGKDHIAVRGSEGKFNFREVTLGISNDQLVEVKSGLKENDLVALNPMSLMSEDEKRDAFGSSSKDGTKKDWGPDAKKVGTVPVLPGVPAVGGADKAKAKVKGQRGGFMSKMDPAAKAKFQSGTDEEKRKIMEENGVPADMVDRILERMKSGGGGGGFGGPPGGGGFGGPGGGGGGPGGGSGGGFGGPGGGGNRP